MKNRLNIGIVVLSIFALLLAFSGMATAGDGCAKKCASKDTKVCQKADGKTCHGDKQCAQKCTDKSACKGSATCGKHAKGAECCPPGCCPKDCCPTKDGKTCCPKGTDTKCCPKKGDPGK
jgi:hypothetical protein